jgi:hypothetical protein
LGQTNVQTPLLTLSGTRKVHQYSKHCLEY